MLRKGFQTGMPGTWTCGAISVVLLIGGRDETISSIKYPKEELVVG